MSRFTHSYNRVSVVGIDGSGKSTAAQVAAQRLSEEYDLTPIRVVDSTGISHYKGGQLSHVHFQRLGDLKAPADSGRVNTLVRTGLFTASRRALESLSSHTPGLTVSVRDPYRIDPATMLPEYVRPARNLSPKQRLAICNSLTRAAHPSEVIRLDVDPRIAYDIAVARGELDSHETPEALSRAAADLISVTESYASDYSVKTSPIEALQHNTIDKLAELVEPHLPNCARP